MREELEATIKQLQEQLEGAEDLNADEISQLRESLDQLQDTLDHQDVNSASLADRIREQTQQFQESHPTLTQQVGRIADILAQMGI